MEHINNILGDRQTNTITQGLPNFFQYNIDISELLIQKISGSFVLRVGDPKKKKKNVQSAGQCIN